MDSIQIALPGRLIQSLQQLAQEYYVEGINLFIFGSFARGDNRPNSDLDLGIEWHGQRNPDIFRRLYEDVQSLPTIRKIELVDFAQTDAAFQQIAGAQKIYLHSL
jgi:predicted nucleotidyltransferase